MKLCKFFSPVRDSLYCQDCNRTKAEHYDVESLLRQRDELRAALTLVVENCDRYDGVLPSKWMADTIGTNDMACVLGLIRESRNAYDVMTSEYASTPEQMASLLRLRIALSPFADAKTVPATPNNGQTELEAAEAQRDAYVDLLCQAGAELDELREALAMARVIVERIGTVDANDSDNIRRAGKWIALTEKLAAKRAANKAKVKP